MTPRSSAPPHAPAASPAPESPPAPPRFALVEDATGLLIAHAPTEAALPSPIPAGAVVVSGPAIAGPKRWDRAARWFVAVASTPALPRAVFLARLSTSRLADLEELAWLATRAGAETRAWFRLLDARDVILVDDPAIATSTAALVTNGALTPTEAAQLLATA